MLGWAFTALGFLLLTAFTLMGLRVAQSFLFAIIRRDADIHEQHPWGIIVSMLIFAAVNGLVAFVLFNKLRLGW
jgi:hypothetical protein